MAERIGSGKRGPGKSSGKGPGKGKGRSARVTSRNLTTRVRTARGRKTSSTRWLQRQLNDPYVAEARRLGYRSRAAFKLIELDDQFHFLKPGGRIVDLGAAPGGWTQVAVQRTTNKDKIGKIVGMDILAMEAVPGATLFEHDFLDDDAPRLLIEALDGPADVVLSDMAASATGHRATDHMRIIALLETALDFAYQVLAPDGAFIGKVLQGGTETQLLAAMKQNFRTVRHAKPPASRDGSAESYVVALGYRGDTKS
ncbi:MAG: RlmE family RNA methyltransferase [Rhodospirillaceae bacterium]|jgi:23S rRNA (uridine2552-2'-O)-methyltransferase|nr:RlmE family RNA methyltransferase [Rhodospirillaceae bacterium]